MKESAAVIIQNKHKELLLLKRGAACRNEIGKWENLGGETNEGESSEDCIQREAREEIGIKLKIKKKLFIVDDGNGWSTTLFLGYIVNGEPKIQEEDKISEIGWYPLEKILDLDLTSYTRVDFEKTLSKSLL